jgi:hypothetical protein
MGLCEEEVDLAIVAPGAELAGLLVMSGLVEREGAGLSDPGLIEALKAAHRIGAWAAAVELSAISELDRRRVAEARALGCDEGRAAEFTVDEVALALVMTGSTAAIRAAVAWRLKGSLSDTYQALVEGRIDFEKARVLSDAVTGLTEDDATAVQDQVLEAAERATTGQLRALIRKALAEIAPEEQAERKEKAQAARRLELWPTEDGTVDLSVRDLSEETAHACFNRVNALARACKSDGDARPIDQLRADIAADLLRGLPLPRSVDPSQAASPAKQGKSKTANPGQPQQNGQSDGGGLAAAVAGDVGRQVRAQLGAALAGLTMRRRAQVAAQAGERIRAALRDLAILWCGGDPEARDRAGAGQERRNHDERQATDRAERLMTAADSSSRQAIGGGAIGGGRIGGEEAGHGHAGYRPPGRMRRQIVQRDLRCVFPSCRRSAEQCDIDHTVAYHQGGATCPCNLAVLCRHHHRTKQQRGWRLIQIWPGLLLWITPTGQWHLTGPGEAR